MASLSEPVDDALHEYSLFDESVPSRSSSVFYRIVKIGLYIAVGICCLASFATIGTTMASNPAATNALGNVTELLSEDIMHCTSRSARWMWGDASIIPLIGHWVAEHDPFRWSSWKSTSDTINELKRYIDKDRPVEIEQHGCGMDFTKTYSSVGDAIQKLGGSLSSQSMPFRFDPGISKTLALVSAVAYDDSGPCQSQVSDWTCRRCRESGLVIAPGSVGRFSPEKRTLYGFTAKLQGPSPFADACVVAFRGTSNPVNFVDDLDEILVETPRDWSCPSCYVHQGFLNDWLSFEAEVVGALHARACQKQGVILTGHSLGGALATLGAWALKHKHGFELSMVYTYESPRVGNAGFASAWDTGIAKTVPSFRITYDYDPVPEIPCQFGQFVHVRYEVHYERDGSSKVIPDRESSCAEFDFVSALTTGDYVGHCYVPYVPDGNICSAYLSSC